MSRDQRVATGRVSFNTFAYLLHSAECMAETARERIAGSNYARASASLLAAFAVEAHLNHVGQRRLSHWKFLERASWTNKLEMLETELKMSLPRGQRPFQTIRDLFKFRNEMAHGQSVEDIEDRCLPLSEDGEVDIIPDWLKPYHQPEIVNRVLEDARDMIRRIHSAAGLEEYEICQLGGSVFGYSVGPDDLERIRQDH